MSRLLPVLLLLLSIPGLSQNLKQVDQYYEEALNDWDVPGFAVAVVKDGKVVFEKGYGVLEAGGTTKVDEHSLFAIASNTKAFIASAIAKLHQEGTLDLADPVTKYIPGFRLYDDYASTHARVQDLLTHNLGLGTFSGDVIWYKSNFTVPQVIERIQYVPKAYEFRGGYGYSNMMYITAGEVIHRASGKNWDQYIQETFLHPLGMRRTQTSVDNLRSMSNVATPHKWINGTHKPIGWAPWNNSGAAGGIISSVHDMAQWMIFHLNRGNHNGQVILEGSTIDEMIYPRNTHKITVDSRKFLPSRHFNGYGLGFGLYDMHGYLVVTHSGGYDGMYSRLAMIPELNMGVVVLTNAMTGIGTALSYYTMDRFASTKERDWSRELLEAFRNRKKAWDDRENARISSRVMNTAPSLPQKELLGDYYDPFYGIITVRSENDRLILEFADAPLLTAELTHWHFDTYKINWKETHAWFDFGTVQFISDNNRKVTGFEFDVPNDDIFFDEIHPKKR